MSRIKKNSIIRFLYNKYLVWKTSRLYNKSLKSVIDFNYRRILHKQMDWENPIDLNEKINWLKLYSDTSLWSELTDKYKVRDYVEKCGFPDILVKIYGKWDCAENIDWKSLPNQFVMKVNNGTGDVLICDDKTKLDTQKVTKYFSKLLKKKYGMVMGEPHYFSIKPCVIAEELLDVTKQTIPSTSLVDYKIWCFNGKPECIRVYYNRTNEAVNMDTYDINWNKIPNSTVYSHIYKESNMNFPKPVSLERMLDIASILSKDFPEVRVDLYEVDNKPYFGEMTFTSSSGYMVTFTEHYLKYLGGLVHLK